MEDVFNGVNSIAARRTCPENLCRVATRKLDQLDSVGSLQELRIPPGNRRGQHSICINYQYRICFIWTEQGLAQVKITDYH